MTMSKRTIDQILDNIEHPAITRVGHHDGAPQAYPEDRIIRFVDGSHLSTAPDLEWDDNENDEVIVGYLWGWHPAPDTFRDAHTGATEEEREFVSSIIAYADQAQAGVEDR